MTLQKTATGTNGVLMKKPSVLLFVLSFGLCIAVFGEESTPYRLKNFPPIKSLMLKATPEEENRIKQLIDDLALVDSPDFGYSATISGSGFSPLPQSFESGVSQLTNHGLNPSGTVLELVKFGPRALPLLLDSLDDKRSTKLTVEKMMGIWFETELPINPLNPREEKSAIRKLPMRNIRGSNTRYTLKIGDLCFAIVGQIVGRSYQAIRYQPSALVVVNSTTRNRDFSRLVQSIWESPDPGQHILDSLLVDYHSEAVDRKSWDENYYLRILPCRAAMRMFYYYPKETTPIVADRLRGLDLSEDFFDHQFPTRVSTIEFLKSVSWCKEPAIVEVLRDIAKRTASPYIMIFATTGQSEFSEKRFREFIAKLPPEEDSSTGQGYVLLFHYGDRFPKRAFAVFENYLKSGGKQRGRTLCEVLSRVCVDYSVDLLEPLLTDRTEFKGWLHPYDSDNPDKIRYPIRMCDFAAQVMAMNDEKIEFKLEGNYRELNRQIYLIKEEIRKRRGFP